MAHRKEVTVLLTSRQMTLETLEQHEGYIDMASGNTIEVGAERIYNVDNYEAVRVHVTIRAEVPEGKKAIKIGRKIAEALPDEIQNVFDEFASQHKLVHKFPTLKKGKK